ncbi:MAG: DUF748 domain-containing protein [Chromatiales bacterium]|nr:DUF748 domain-containing protein [Chromatiales bacterium]
MFRRLLAPLFLPLALLVAALVFSLPWIAEQALLTNLRAQGYQASLQALDIAPGRLALRKLHVSRDGEVVTRIQNLVVRFGIGDLLRGRVMIREVLVDGALLTLREQADGGWELLGMPAVAKRADAATDQPEEAVATPDLGLGRIDLRDSRLRLLRRFGERVANIQLAYVGPLATWEADNKTPYQLVAHGDFGSLRATGHVTPFATPMRAHADITWLDGMPDRVVDFVQGGLPAPLTALGGRFRSHLVVDASNADDVWRADGRIDMQAVGIAVATRDRERLDAAELNIDTTFSADANAHTLAGRVSGHGVSSLNPQGVLRIGEYTWQGTAGQRTDGAGAHQFTEAKVELKAIALDSDADQRGSLAHLAWNGRGERQPNGQMAVNGALTADDAEIALTDLSAKLRGVTWNGSLTGDPTSTMSVDGELRLAGLAANQGQRTVGAELLHWQGQADIDTATPRTKLLGGLALTDAAFDGDGVSAKLAGLNAAGLSLVTGAEGIESVDTGLHLNGLQASQHPHRLAIAELDAPALEFRPPNALRAGMIAIGGIQADVVHQAPTPARTGAPTNQASASTAPAGDGPETDIAVAGVALRGGHINFRDETLSPAFTAQIKGIDLKLGAFASARPDTPSEIELSAILGEAGQLDLSGSVRPLQPTAFADLKGALLGFDMPTLNPYLRSELGEEVESGQLDVNADIGIERNQLDVRNQIEVRKLVLRKAGGATSASHARSEPLPAALDQDRKDELGGGSLLNSAVSLLSDSNDTIKLKLPITGAVDDPKFDLSDAINTALSKSIATGVLLYFQPLGALVAVGKLASSQFSVLEFNPVAFKPGDANLDGEAKAYLADLAKRLADRPNINVKVCAVATESDRAALTPKAAPPAKEDSAKQETPPPPAVDNVTLLKLAKERANSVTRHLSANLGIAATRLVGCAAGIAKQADATPGVRLGQ